MINDIKSFVSEHLSDVQSLLEDDMMIKKIQDAIDVISTAFKNEQKILFCGNGGSAADAEHLAGELSGKFKIDRPPLFAEALHVNGAALTAVANDYDFSEAFSRLLLAKGKQNDILFAMSTSGQSSNILKAIVQAKKISMPIIGMTGNFDSEFENLCDIHIKIQSRNTPRIQEVMMLIGHIICEKVENKLFG